MTKKACDVNCADSPINGLRGDRNLIQSATTADRARRDAGEDVRWGCGPMGGSSRSRHRRSRLVVASGME